MSGTMGKDHSLEERLLADDALHYTTEEHSQASSPSTPASLIYCETDGTTSYQLEIKTFLGYMAPIFVNQLIWRYFSIVGPVVEMSRAGPTYLAGSALGNTTINLFCTLPSYAATSALDTLSTQAHGGARRSSIKDLNRLYCLRVLLLKGILLLFLGPLIYCFKPIFLLLRIDPEVADVSVQCMRYAVVGMPAFYAYEVLRKYCQAQGRMTGTAIAVALGALTCMPLLRSQFFGVYTPAAALALFWISMFAYAVIYAFYFLPGRGVEDMPSFRVIAEDMSIVFKFTVAGFVSIGAEHCAWEVLSICAAWLGPTALAAQGILLTSEIAFYSLPSSLSASGATRVGNYIGLNQPINARCAALTSLSMGGTVAAICASVVATHKKYWLAVFTDDEAVLATLDGIVNFFCIVSFFDAIQGIACGILRGAGMAIEIAHVMAIGHYAFGIPLAMFLAFGLEQGVFGLWLGFGCGLLIVGSRLGYLIYFNDWHQNARNAQAHILESAERAELLGSNSSRMPEPVCSS